MKRIELSSTKTALLASTNCRARLRLVRFEPFSIGLVILTFFTKFVDTSAVGIRMGIADVCDGHGEHILPCLVHFDLILPRSYTMMSL